MGQLLPAIDRALLLDAIRTQDLLSSDCQRLAYGREQLAEAALSIVQTNFSALDFRRIEIKDNVVLSINSTAHLVVLRCLNQIIKRAVGIQPSDRDTIVRRLITVLTEGVPHRLYKFDIRKFFDSVSTLELFGRLSNETQIPRSAILVLENFLFDLTDRHQIGGLPRGIQLSATLSEYAMKGFDRFVSRLPEVYYYARYVDDIIIVTGAREDKVEFERRIKRALPLGLQLNSAKTKYVDVPVQYKSDGLTIIGDFDYLGYNFSIHETKRIDGRFSRAVDVTLAPRKIRRLKSRISRAVAGFIVDGNKQRLERRLQLLTGNYNLRDLPNGRLRNVGLYCNYRRANSNVALLKLDSFLRSIFIGNRCALSRRLCLRMPYHTRRSFLRFSFTQSFADRTFYNFRASELAELTLCWRDA